MLNSNFIKAVDNLELKYPVSQNQERMKFLKRCNYKHFRFIVK